MIVVSWQLGCHAQGVPQNAIGQLAYDKKMIALSNEMRMEDL